MSNELEVNSYCLTHAFAFERFGDTTTVGTARWSLKIAGFVTRHRARAVHEFRNLSSLSQAHAKPNESFQVLLDLSPP